MTKEHVANEERVTKPSKAKDQDQGEHRLAGSGIDRPGLASLHHQIGNQAVQRLLAQRAGGEAFDLDDETAERINSQRGGGQPLDSTIQQQAGEAMGHDLSGVRAHTSPEADELSQQLGAKAFTTGQDIFFRQGAYDPGSTGGQELIAHELTHVVQQSTGAVGGGGGPMTVNAPGDAFEQEADAVAKAVASPATTSDVQRQAVPEEEEEVPSDLQVPELGEEEELEGVQRQELEEEEEITD